MLLCKAELKKSCSKSEDKELHEEELVVVIVKDHLSQQTLQMAVMPTLTLSFFFFFFLIIDAGKASKKRCENLSKKFMDIL